MIKVLRNAVTIIGDPDSLKAVVKILQSNGYILHRYKKQDLMDDYAVMGTSLDDVDDSAWHK